MPRRIHTMDHQPRTSSFSGSRAPVATLPAPDTPTGVRTPLAGTHPFAGIPSATAGEGYAVRVTPSSRLGRASFEVTFSLTMKAERGGKIADAFLEFGDGSSPVRVRGYAVKRHTYRKPGSFRAKLTIETRKGERLSSRSSRLQIYPEHPADPAELLSVERGEGIAPFEARFALGGESLPFVANAARLDFGDGTSRRVALLSYSPIVGQICA